MVQPLGSIADTSRELADSMNDIVWALDPRRGYLNDLTSRMRHFANETLSAADIEINFQAPLEGADASVPAEIRRDIFRIFKESINNIVRHSHARRVEVLIELRQAEMLIKLRDDGQGFEVDRSAKEEGHGLFSMRTRAIRMGGRLEVASKPGVGTTIILFVPLASKGSSAGRILTLLSHWLPLPRNKGSPQTKTQC